MVSHQGDLFLTGMNVLGRDIRVSRALAAPRPVASVEWRRLLHRQ